jgi:pimeloyl-ACP methyl ester carboxylesterase
MLVELVRTTTRDGVRLDGAFQAAASSSGGGGLGLDGACLVHGTGGNFYSSALLEAFAERLPGLGCAVLRVNTRGHDVISNAATAQGGRRLGAAYEVVDDCRHDLAAWLDWLRQRAGPRLALIGHSLGAVKCLYATAHEPPSGVRGVVAVSPPRLSYAHFVAGPEAPRFLEDFARAERHVREGRPAALLDVTLPLPTAITAAGYVEKYGPDERYDYVRLLRAFPCPVLVTFGGQEVEANMAFRGAPEVLAALPDRRARLAVETVAGADHFYITARDELLRRVEAWLGTALGPTGSGG